MTRLLACCALCLVATTVRADDSASSVESFLHDGRFAEGETAMLLALDANPDDGEARFGLGVIQVLRAVENLGRALYDYGAVSERAHQRFLRLPVPANENPSAVSYRELGRVLDAFANDLDRAEATLARIRGDDVKLPLRLAKIPFDFTGTGEERTTLMEVLHRITDGRLKSEQENPDFRVHFDRGDVAWLRGYCHLLSGMVEGYRALDYEQTFAQRVGNVFPKVETSGATDGDAEWHAIRVVDAPRLRRMRLHLIAVCELNDETWAHIRRETDDDYEWLPAPQQTDHLGMPMTDELIDAWLAMMRQFEELLKGERLLPGSLLCIIDPDHDQSQGLNLRTLLDDPPVDLLNQQRIQEQGINAKYLEPESGKPLFDFNALFAVFRLLSGPFGTAQAIRLN